MIISKLFLSCIIIVSSTFIGIETANKYILRTRELRDFQYALARLETEILHYSTRLPDALKYVGESINGQAGVPLIITAAKLGKAECHTVSQAWEEAFQEQKSSLHLEKEDYEILMKFGKQLGISDKDGQKKYIDLALDQLKRQEQKAQEAVKKYVKMYKSLGLLGGLAIAIILL